MELNGMRIYVLYVLYLVINLAHCNQDEKRLHSDLLEKRQYNKLIRPSPGGKEALVVQLGMRLSQLLYVDEKNQIMTSNVWLRHQWTDQRLRWNPAEYANINMTHIPSEKLWRPDIVLYNNADGSFVVTLLTKATVYYSGKIIWLPPAIYKSYCPIDVEYFPFDMQECFMKFGSWTYDGLEVDLRHVCDERGIVVNKETEEMMILGGIDLKDFYPSVEWDVINVTARRKIKYYPCCPEPYPDITFHITIRRRTLFYTMNLITPCISISCLTVLVFYLPSDSGEKITLSISILLALTVFFLLLSDINPPTSFVIPLIGKYLLFTMVVVTMSIFLTVYTLNINFRTPTTHTMSPWVRKVFTEILPRIMMIQRPEADKRKKSVTSGCNGLGMSEILTTEWQSMHTYENERPRPENIDSFSRYPSEIKEAVIGVKYLADHYKKNDEEILEIRDWKYVAMVMDRLFLFIFSTACFTVCEEDAILIYHPSHSSAGYCLSADSQRQRVSSLEEETYIRLQIKTQRVQGKISSILFYFRTGVLCRRIAK
ncbi:hypothetical protein ScPMuIL_018421 [Solemya velum]